MSAYFATCTVFSGSALGYDIFIFLDVGWLARVFKSTLHHKGALQTDIVSPYSVASRRRQAVSSCTGRYWWTAAFCEKDFAAFLWGADVQLAAHAVLQGILETLGVALPFLDRSDYGTWRGGEGEHRWTNPFVLMHLLTSQATA